MNILAMDLGKSETVFCEYDSKSAKHKFGKVKTSPQQIHNLLVEKAPDKVTSALDSLGKKDTAVQRLQSIPGVGPRLSEAIVAYLDKPER